VLAEEENLDQALSVFSFKIHFPHTLKFSDCSNSSGRYCRQRKLLNS
jgi:hypothetical protein